MLQNNPENIVALNAGVHALLIIQINWNRFVCAKE